MIKDRKQNDLLGVLVYNQSGIETRTRKEDEEWGYPKYAKRELAFIVLEEEDDVVGKEWRRW